MYVNLKYTKGGEEIVDLIDNYLDTNTFHLNQTTLV